MSRSEREPLDLRLVPAAVTAWVVAWQVRAVPPGRVVLLAGVLAVAGVVLLLRSPRRSAAGLAAALLCAAAAGTCTAARVQTRTAEPLPALAARGAAVVVLGTVTDDPREAGPQPGGRPLVLARFRIERLTSAGRSYRLRAPAVVLSGDRGWLGLLPGQRVRAEGRLRAVERGDDAAAVLSARGRPAALGRPGPVQRLAGRMRSGLREAAAVLPDDERGLLPGLVVGDTSRLDPALRDDFTAVGLTHLVAVSGTNCAIVAGVVLLLARRLGAGARLAPVVAALALLGFVVLVRPSPSVLRAAVMGGVGLLGLGTGSRRAALPALACSVLLLVLLDPDLAATAGFALSVLATGGLLVLAPGWRDRLARHLPLRLAEAVAVPAAAQVVCGPVVVALSGSLGVLSVPANLVAVPAVVPATLLGVLAALVAPVCLPAAQLLAWAAWAPTAWLVLVARTGARAPGAQVGWPDGRAGAALLAAVTLMAALVLSRPVLRRIAAASSAGVLLALVGLAAVRPGWPPPGWFMVTCDVGQGDAHVLHVGDGSAVVVDAGPDAGAVDACLRALDVRTVPLVLLTHLHADHVDGLPGVLDGRAVARIEVGPLADPPAQWTRVRGWAGAAGVPLVAASLGETRHAGALSWVVLAPSHAYRGTRSDPNNSSVVLDLHVGPVRVLLTGDVEPEAQRDLLRTVHDLRSDVIKVPHHGSDHQEASFLRAVQPRVALTSVGVDNGYGHPSAATLGLLESGGARTYRTDRDGDVALVLQDGHLLSSGRRGDGVLRGPAAQALRSRPPGPAVAAALVLLPGPGERAVPEHPAAGRSARAARTRLGAADAPTARARSPPGRARACRRTAVPLRVRGPAPRTAVPLRVSAGGGCPYR